MLFAFITVNAIFLNSTNVALYLYSPEIYPTRMRALGTSIATGWARVASFSAPITVGAVMGAFNLATVFALFAVVTLLGAFTALRFMIETKERRLEEIST